QRCAGPDPAVPALGGDAAAASRDLGRRPGRRGPGRAAARRRRPGRAAPRILKASGMDETRVTLFGKFREEVDTHLLRLSQGVIALEQDPANSGLLKEIFRSAHTVKGAAKMMGFPEIVRVTHEMESVLGVMRDGHLLLTPGISDLL